jgi:hypothetical protein
VIMITRRQSLTTAVPAAANFGRAGSPGRSSLPKACFGSRFARPLLLVVGSLPGLAADLLSMATGATMLLQRSPAIRSAVTSMFQLTGLPRGA